MPYFKLFVFLCLGVSSGQQAPIMGGSSSMGGSSGKGGSSSMGASSAGVTTSTPESSIDMSNNNANSVLDFLSDLLQNNTQGRPNCSFFTCGAACQGRCGWSSTFNRCLYGAHTRLSEMNKGPGCLNSTTSLTFTTFTSSTLTTSSYTSSTESTTTSSPSSSAPSSSAPSSSAPSSSAPSSVSRFSSNNLIVSNSPTNIDTDTDENATDIVTNAAVTDIDTDDDNATDIDITAKGSTSSQSSNGNSSNIIIFPITAFILLVAIVGLTQLRSRQKRDISETRQPYTTSPVENPNFYAVPNTRIRQRSPKTASIVSDHSYYEQPVPLNKRGFVSDVYSSVFSPQNYYNIDENIDNGFYDNVNGETQYDLADTEQMATYDLADTEQMATYELADTEQMATYDLAGSDNFYDAAANMNID